jgi:hypothetical protein
MMITKKFDVSKTLLHLKFRMFFIIEASPEIMLEDDTNR